MNKWQINPAKHYMLIGFNVVLSGKDWIAGGYHCNDVREAVFENGAWRMI